MVCTALRFAARTFFVVGVGALGVACSSAPEAREEIGEAPQLAVGVLHGVSLWHAPTSLTTWAQPSNAANHPAPADFDGDGKTDMSYRASDGYWLIDLAANGFGPEWDLAYGGYGSTEAIVVPADYDGDRKADLSVKDSGGTWHIDLASNGYGKWDYEFRGYGDNSGVPTPADFDGDGRADFAVKGSDGNWYVDYSNSGANVQPPPAIGAFGSWDVIIGGRGGSGFTPVPADYDGDGRADMVVIGPDGRWWFDYSNTPAAAPSAPGNFGGTFTYSIRPSMWTAGAMPAVADYDDDAKADIAFKDSAGGIWIDESSNGFGTNDLHFTGYGGYWSTPAPGDYDGDFKADLSVRDNDDWYVDYASDNLGGWNVTVPLPQARTWSVPTIPGFASCSVFNYTRDFLNDGSATAAFEQKLAGLGCGYSSVTKVIRFGDQYAPGYTSPLSFFLTTCDDTPALRAVLTSTVDEKEGNGTVVDAAKGGGPYLSHRAPKECQVSLPETRAYVLWDPFCPGGCPVLADEVLGP
jgi:hypothetical protein